MPLRISHKLSRIIQFPRLVLIELGAIRQAQTRLEEAQTRLEEAQTQMQEAQTRLEEAQTRLEQGIEKWTLSASGRLENFFRMSLQTKDVSGDLIVSIKRQIDDLEATLQELKQRSIESEQINDTVRSEPNF
jgi:outer membrane protein TolC